MVRGRAAGIWQTVVDRRPTGRAHYAMGVELTADGADSTSFSS